MRAARSLALCVLAVALGNAAGQEPKKPDPKAPGKRPQQGSLKAGDKAPAFELTDVNGENAVKLADLKGKPVVLVFGSCT
jgi:cytochrome oxidase Cu insertion factor (SCO1/SenC/PrrC family)